MYSLFDVSPQTKSNELKSGDRVGHSMHPYPMINAGICFEAPGIYRPANLMSNFDSMSRIHQRLERDILFVVHIITDKAYIICPYDIDDQGFS
ncbi:hypothetical protein TNCV_2709301 [Trichonephila clavipes]|nr:hypothetical protein TNCV_2709301 [Trichonephila clavipes]